MKYGQVETNKLYFTSSEAAEQVGVPVKTLHSWEKKYHALKPKINRAGKRVYRQTDIEIAKQINDGILQPTHKNVSHAQPSASLAAPTSSLLKIRSSLQKALEKIQK